MYQLIARRAGRAILTLWLLVTLVFIAIELVPGSPVDSLLSAGADRSVVETMRRDLGLDRPLLIRYFDFIAGIATGDFGTSWRSGASVSAQLVSAFGHTFLLASAGMLVATVLGAGGGVLAALHRNSLFDASARITALIGISVPIFVINIAGIYLFAYYYPWLPTSGSSSWSSLILPAVTLGIAVAALILRLVRSATLDILNQDFIRAAYSRGISGRAIIWRHVIPNTAVTLVTMIGVQFGLLLGGSVITETVFAWPGLGQMTVQAVQTQDMPIVRGAVVVFAASFMFINFVVDMLYPILDPRVGARA